MDYILNPTEENEQKLKLISEKIFSSSRFFCFLLYIDDYEVFKKTHSQSNIKLFLYGVDNILKEVFAEYGFTLYSVNDTEKTMVYVMTFNGTGDVNLCYDKASKKSMNSLLEYININTSYFMSKEYPIYDLYYAYKEVHSLIQYRFIYKERCILNSFIIPDDEDLLFIKAKSCYRQLKEALTTNNNQYVHAMDNLFDLMHRLQINHIREILTQLLVYVDELVIKMGAASNMTPPLEILKDFLSEKIYYDDAVIYLKDIINILMNIHQNEAPGNNLLLILDKCKTIISQEYNDQNLCVEMIAEKLGFSANYLGRKFKEHEGCSIAEMLKNKRLEAASELLTNTNDSINSIIDKSGFTSTSHFNSAFKTKFGCSPTTYRITHRNESI